MIETSPSFARYQTGERVALFLPCYCDALYPQVGKAMVSLFERVGVPLEYPLEQTCCGQPAFNAGYWNEAGALARRFAQIFEAYRWIVVPSGSCGAMTRSFYDYLNAGQAASETGARVYDLATFLVKVLGRVDVGARFERRVTYHDGCHGRRELGASDAAIALLRAVRDIDYVELPHVEECCGFGGLFAVKYPQLSVSMGKAKLRCIIETGAQVVASGDTTCLMHVEGLLRKEQPNSGLQFLHIAEILAQA
jgi:L-lactate dehydrogenase complex protein LldE